jgi:hypothetical protein
MKNKLILSCVVAILGAFGANAAPKFQNVHLIADNGNPATKVTLIKNSQRWTADTVYIIDRLTFVEAPAVLTIEPGTIIRMEQKTTGGTSVTDPADVGTLIICRGAKIVANGTAESPIVITNIDDEFVDGGVSTIPNNHNNVTLNSTYASYSDSLPLSSGAPSATTRNYTRRDYSGNKRFDYDATCGGLIILGRTPVGFGAPTSGGGNLQVNIANVGDGYELETANSDPTNSSYGRYTISLGASAISPNLGFAGNLLFDQHGSIKRVIVTSGGKYNSAVPPTLTFAGTTAKKSNVSVPGLVSADPVTAPINYSVVMAAHPDADGTFTISRIDMSATKSERGYGFAGATLVASGANQVTPPTLNPVVGRSLLQVLVTAAGTGYSSGTTYTVTMPTHPTTALSGVAVVAPTTAAQLTATVTTLDYADPSTSRSGIGANFIEGFQTVDGALLGTSQVVGGTTYNYSGSIYGGSTDNDNSGTLRFVSIRYGGFILSPNNEINGLTCGAVGRGTLLEFIEIANNADDGIEHFGGSVDMKYVADLFGGDDGIDLDQGYRGRIQFAFQLQNNTTDTSRNPANIGDRLGEWDGSEAPNTSRPYTVHTLFNFTGIGSGRSTGTSGVNYKDNSGGKVFNSIFADSKLGIVLETGAAAIGDNVDGSTAGSRFGCTRSGGGVENLLGVASNVGAGEPDACIKYTSWRAIGGSTSFTDTAAFTSLNRTVGINWVANLGTGGNNDFVDNTSDFRGIARVNTSGGLDPRLTDLSGIRDNGVLPSASGGVRTADTFYTQTKLRGAFRDCNWLSGWSTASQWGLLSTANCFIPAVRLSRVGDALTVGFTPETNVEYSVETSTDGKVYTPYTTYKRTTGTADASVSLGAGTASLLRFVRVMPL